MTSYVSRGIGCFFWILMLTETSAGKSPPHPLPQNVQQIAPSGSTATLPCPVHSDAGSLFFEWSRDREPLDHFGGHRVRVQNNGSLRIKAVSSEDTGVYLCRAVNGFGSVEVNVTLIVIDDEDESKNLYPDHASEGHQGASQIEKKMTELLGMRPVNTTVEHGGVATLECLVKSTNSPRVVQWLKLVEETKEESKNSMVKVHGQNYKLLKTSEAREMGDGSLFSRLTIPEAKDEDSGKYVCLVATADGTSLWGAALSVLPRSGSGQSTPPFPVIVTACILGGALVASLLLLWFLCSKKRKSSSRVTKDAVSMETKEALVSPH